MTEAFRENAERLPNYPDDSTTSLEHKIGPIGGFLSVDFKLPPRTRRTGRKQNARKSINGAPKRAQTMNFLCWHERNFRNDFHLVDCKAHFHHRIQKTIKLNKNKARSLSHENIHEWPETNGYNFEAMMRLNDFHHSPAIDLREKRLYESRASHTAKRAQHKKSHAQTQNASPSPAPHRPRCLQNDAAELLAPIFRTCAAAHFGVHQMCIRTWSVITRRQVGSDKKFISTIEPHVTTVN